MVPTTLNFQFSSQNGVSDNVGFRLDKLNLTFDLNFRTYRYSYQKYNETKVSVVCFIFSLQFSSTYCLLFIEFSYFVSRLLSNL